MGYKIPSFRHPNRFIYYIMVFCTDILELYLFLFYVEATIGFNQTAYTFEEGDGTVEVCATFLKPRDPSQIAPNLVVELMGSTSSNTADG